MYTQTMIAQQMVRNTGKGGRRREEGRILGAGERGKGSLKGLKGYSGEGGDGGEIRWSKWLERGCRQQKHYIYLPHIPQIHIANSPPARFAHNPLRDRNNLSMLLHLPPRTLMPLLTTSLLLVLSLTLRLTSFKILADISPQPHSYQTIVLLSVLEFILPKVYPSFKALAVRLTEVVKHITADGRKRRKIKKVRKEGRVLAGRDIRISSVTNAPNVSPSTLSSLRLAPPLPAPPYPAR